MSLLSKLFGGGKTAAEPQSEVYQDMRIFPEPMKEGNTFRLSARIEKIEGDSVKEHMVIRADTFSDRDEAVAASIAKAKQMIDEQGDNLFAPR